jgi:cysteinyl-tRNA synthetase
MKIYNSLTRTKEEFEPIDPDHIKLYVCGPTVYSYAHIGNARAAVVFDTLRCLLEHVYPRVTHVANITDIDDKIIDAANAAGVPISDVTEKYAKIYNDDMASLGVKKPTHQPKATDHVDGMIAMIETLIEKGHAYENEGHVLFNVPSYDGYGRLSGRNRDEQVMGARVEVAPYKKDPADFVLWKPSNENQPGWESPWGNGRPGWHIECSVMAEHYLGKAFDIHGGGLDLTFPHHENEIAQSCCSSGEDEFANYWMHNGFVTVEGEKMSKSIGNVLLVHDMINDGMKGEAVRFALLSTHYRQPFDWTQDGVDNATKTLNKWYRIFEDVEQGDDADDADDAVVAAMCDDMNTPKAIAELHRLAKEKSSKLKTSANVLGLLTQDVSQWNQGNKATKVDADKVEALIQERKDARANKDFARSDEIRDELLSMGVEIKDGRDGTTWSLV